VFVVLGVGALLAIVATTIWLVGQAGSTAAALTQSRQLRSALVDLLTMVQQAETGQRGYLLTQDPAYLAPFDTAASRVAPQLDRIRALQRQEPADSQQTSDSQMLDQLEASLVAKMAELQQTVDLNRAGQRDAALALVKTNLGRDAMDNARILLATLISNADKRVGDRIEAQRDSLTSLRSVTIIGALVIVTVTGGAIRLAFLYTRQLVETQQQIEALNINLEERVRERTADLARANEEIQRFAYIVTHDLRAPLVNIMGFTSELEASLAAISASLAGEGTPPPSIVAEARAAVLTDVPESIGFIRSSTRKMDALINAILKLSRDGRRRLRPEPIDLRALLSAASDALRHQISEAGGTLTIEGAAPRLISDRLALEQIIGNLLDNAVKYRDPRRALKIRIAVNQQPGARVTLVVEDNGRGIAARDHERVFDLFRRSGTQDQPGEGIGLAHVRSIVRGLGGEISLVSALGQGTTFTIALPGDLRAVIASV
jgi:signal transduction histidine kinase